MEKVNFQQLLSQDNIFLGIQFLLTALIVFFSASGLHFPVSVFLMLNTIVYLLLNERYSTWIIQNSAIGKIFFCLALVDIISYSNIIPLRLPHIFLFNRSNHFSLFTYSLAWFFNFSFAAVYLMRVRTFKYITYLGFLFFLCAIYSNFHAYSFNRNTIGNMTQYHYYYFMMVCIPLIFIKTGKISKYIYLFLVLVAVFFSYKRAGILAIALIFISVFVVDYLHSLRGVVIGVAFLIFGSILINKYINGSEEAIRAIERVERIQTDKGSGRLNNAKTVWSNVVKEPVEDLTFGHGFMSWGIKYKRMIDVEWMSMLYYYGIIGLILYATFFIALICRLVSIRILYFSGNDKIFCAYLACFIIFVVYSISGEMFSYQYLSSLLFLFLGAIEGSIVRKRRLFSLVKMIER